MPKTKKTPVTEMTSDTKAVKPVKEKAPKKVTAPKKSAAPKIVEVVPEPVAPAVTDTAVTDTASDTNMDNMQQDFSNFMNHLQAVTAALGALRTEFRALEKKANRELKTAQKASAKRKRKAGNRSPSGFVKPTLISNELAAFLGKDKGTEMARTDVTREINTYIRANKLQDPQNGRKINADSQLSTLLKLKPDDELTYFNLQKYMSPHFQKQADKLAAAAGSK
jgi:chromatin remodeling complex protein RSC6